MDNYVQNNTAKEKEFLTPYQQQQLNSWKNTLHKALLDAWPYVYRAINEILILVLKAVRGSFRIMKEQLFKSS